MRNWRKWFFLLLIALQIVPFFIPAKNKELIPKQPFYNSSFLEVENITLHYRIWDSFKNRGKVLLIHGLGGSTYSWEETAMCLQREGFDVLAVDLPGFGYSERNTSYSHTQKNRSKLLWSLVDQFEASHEDNGNQGDWVLIGHSMGGGTVSAMAFQEPERTKGLLLIAGALFDKGPGILTKLLWYPPAGKWMEVFLDYFSSDEIRIREILSSANGMDLLVGQYEGYMEPLRIKGTAASLVSMTRTGKSLEEQELRSITVPVYGIWGSADSWVRELETDQIKNVLPQAEFSKIQGAGHLPMETHPEEFQRQLLHWMSILSR